MLSKHNKPTILSAQHYDKKITVEFDHSDTDLNEVMDAVETLIIGMGFSPNGFKDWVLDRASEIREDEEDDFISGDMGMVSFTKEQQKVIDDYVSSLSEEKIDEAFAQHNADEDADEFNDYGMRIHNHD